MNLLPARRRYSTLHLFWIGLILALLLLIAARVAGGGTLPWLTVVTSLFGESPAEVSEFSAAKIKSLRAEVSEAVALPKKIPEGWSKSRVDPAKLLEFFKPLRLREGIVLRAYQYKRGGGGNGVVWAMPADAEFPEPEDCPILESHLFKAPKPSEALDDVMEAIEGDDTPWSYLAASLLRREFKEFGAYWHGTRWGVHTVLDESPWAAGDPKGDGSGLDQPHSKANQWKWLESQPKQWRPQVRRDGEQVIVTFHTYCGLEKQTLFRHVDTYRAGKYRPKVQEQRIAEGPPGFMF